MIRIIFRESEQAVCVTASGHALFDKKGKDIVCASVSVLLQNWANSEKEIAGAEIDTKINENGFESVLKKDGADSSVLFQSLVLGLTVLSIQYQDHIKLIWEDSNGGQYRQKR